MMSYYRREVADPYQAIVLPAGKMYGPVLWTCDRCGAAVHDKRIHNTWHDQIAPPVMCKRCEHTDHTGKVCSIPECLCRFPWPQLEETS